MTDTPHPAAALPAPSPTPEAPAAPPAPVPPAPAPPALDAHGFDPADFEWRPVPRRPRSDGWSPEVQRRFVAALADTGLVSAAAEAVDMSVQSAYRLRRAPGAASFARAWDAALDSAADVLAATAFSRALDGVDMPVFDRDGCRIGSKRHYNDRLLMFLLRAYRPGRFGQVERAEGGTQAAASPAAARAAQNAARPPALEEAMAALAPVAPDAPHRLMPPERLADALDGAAAMAELYHAYPDLDREQYVRPINEPDAPAALHRRHERAARERARSRFDADDAGW